MSEPQSENEVIEAQRKLLYSLRLELVEIQGKLRAEEIKSYDLLEQLQTERTWSEVCKREIAVYREAHDTKDVWRSFSLPDMSIFITAYRSFNWIPNFLCTPMARMVREKIKQVK